MRKFIQVLDSPQWHVNHRRFLLDLRSFFLKQYFFSRIDDRSSKLLRILLESKNFIKIRTSSKVDSSIDVNRSLLNTCGKNINLKQITFKHGGNYRKIIIKCRKLTLVDSQKILPLLLNSNHKDMNMNVKLIIREICILNSLKIILTKYGFNTAIIFRLISLRGKVTIEKVKLRFIDDFKNLLDW